MSEQMADSAIKTLVGNFKRAFPKDGLAVLRKELCAQPDKAIEIAVDHFCLNSSYLPSPAQLIAKVQAEGKKILLEESKQREREWASKKEKPGEGGSLFKHASDEHAKAALMCITAIQKDVPRADKLEFFRMMEDRYPDRGWGNAGAEMQKYWAKDRPHWNPDWRPLSERQAERRAGDL